MSWENLIETAQWTTIFFLFFKGAKNEVRIDTLEEKR